MDRYLSMLRNREPLLWINPEYGLKKGEPAEAVSMDQIYQAEEVFEDYAPVLRSLFPELKPLKGIIESPVLFADDMAAKLASAEYPILPGHLLIKADHLLPVSGSIKARGGIFAVLRVIDRIAEREGIFKKNRAFTLTGEAKRIFEGYSLSVGSTGNLGLSIGIAGRAFGLSVEVHMSSDAKGWKKELLKEIGAEVVEYDADYTAACKAARESAQNNDSVYFIDDENSTDLFLGYGVAALRLKRELEKLDIGISSEHPLFVYLPCGVGGAPGGITYALKHLYGDAVHCFFAEPVDAPAMTLGLVTGKLSGISISDIGLSGNTCADGLAVGRPSEFVGRLMRCYLDGSYTLRDENLLKYLALLYDTEGLMVEPSAAASCAGPAVFHTTEEGQDYLNRQGIKSDKIIHMIWTTGGSMEPQSEFEKNLSI